MSSACTTLEAPPDCAQPAPLASDLLQGLATFSQFLLEAEADFICGATRFRRSEHRTNYRCGYHTRRIHTRLGDTHLRVPHLRHIHMRPSMPKRINRLSDFIIDMLVKIRAEGATPAFVSALIKAVWTMELPEGQLADLAKQACGILELWRACATPGVADIAPPAAAEYAVY